MGETPLSGARPALLVLAVAAALLAAAMPVRADDFVILCKAQANMPDADRVCTCAAGKLAAADRSAALAAMTAINDAQLKGKPIDPATLPPDLSMGFAAATEAESACK